MRVVFALLGLVVLIAALPVRADDLPWVTFVRVVDDTRSGLEPRVAELIKQALLSNANVNVVSSDDLERAARKRRVSKKQWLEPGALAVVARDLEVDYLIQGRIRATSRFGYEVELFGVTPQGEVKGSAKVQITVERGKGREAAAFASADAASVVERLIEVLPPPAADAPPDGTDPPPDLPPDGTDLPPDGTDPPPDGTDPPPDGTSGGDEWDAGFDDTSSGETTDASVVSQLLDELAPTFGGRVSAEGFAYIADLWDPPAPDKIAGRQQVDLALRASVGGRGAAGYASLLVRRDLADETRNRLEAEEAYGDVDFYGFKLRAGRSYLGWGTADLYNVTEILSPYDYRDLLDIEKFPTWVVRGAYSIGPVTFEGYYLPVVEPHLIPRPITIDENANLQSPNRWIKGSVANDDIREAQDANVALRFRFFENAPPPPSLENTQVAARVRVSALGGDASLGYAYLYDRFPTIDVTATVSRPLPLFATIDLDTFHVRRHVVTGDFEYPVGKLRFAGEGALFFPELLDDADAEAEDLNDTAAAVVLGVDWETPRFLEDHAVRIFVNGTATVSLPILDAEKAGRIGTDGLDLMRYPLPLAVLARVEYLLGDNFRIEVTAVNNFGPLNLSDEGELTDDLHALDMMVAPAVQMLFFDVVTARVEAAFLFGDEDGTFGRYAENMRAGGSVGVTF